MSVFDQVYWRQEANGDICLRESALPLAPPEAVSDQYQQLDSPGRLTLPPCNRVLQGTLYGPDKSWTGTLASGGQELPVVSRGWEGLRELTRLRLSSIASLLANSEAIYSRKPETALNIPCLWFELCILQENTVAAAGYYTVELKIGLLAKSDAYLDKLSGAVAAIICATPLKSESWEARGFKLTASGESADNSGIKTRLLVFIFHARQNQAPAEG